MTDDPAKAFEPHRRRLLALAYRMTGSVAEAEDAVQDAYLKWHGTNREAIRDVRAYLSTVVTRLCLDRLRQSRRARESYVGPWLPEPLAGEAVNQGESDEELADDVSVALMLALERLSPLERAAFLLHDVFELDFREVASTLNRSTTACRQLASRARARVQAGRPRFAVPAEQRDQVADAFFGAARSGDTERLRTLLAEGVVFHGDGGGRKAAALKPIPGTERVARFFWAIARRVSWAGPLWSERLQINGMPGRLSVERDGTLQTMTLEIVDGRIEAIYVVRNPDKLSHLIPRVPDEIRASLTGEDESD